jgi:hypothetical protein
MKTSIEVFEDPVKAQARLIELQNAGAINPRKLQVEKLSAYDRRDAPPEPADWIRTRGAGDLLVIQYER